MIEIASGILFAMLAYQLGYLALAVLNGWLAERSYRRRKP